MRAVEYLSPTSLGVWEKDPEEFYLCYLAEDRPERFPQTRPMSVGSAFDAYAKSYLYEALFGVGNNPKFDFEALFEAQVEEQNRDWAREAGKWAFDCYQVSGALADLMLQLNESQGDPRFEFTVQGVIDEYREGIRGSLGPQQVTFLGKPDAHFSTSDGANVVLDWKVNGFCSKNAVSPKRGYVNIRDGWRGGTPSRGVNAPSRGVMPLKVKGVVINTDYVLEEVAPEWARQVAIYAWLCGEEVGADFAVAIDQLACKPDLEDRPKIRVAQHRCRISESFQRYVYSTAADIFKRIEDDHIFKELPFEQSKARCATLDAQAKALRGDGTSDDEWFAAVTRRRF